MELYVFDAARKLEGIVEAFEYLRWTRRYSACGAFELQAIATEGNVALLQTGNILWKSDDEEAAYIEYVELTMNEDGEHITVAGRFLTSLLARRIVWTTETLRGELADMVDQLLTNHLISPSDTSRAISGITYTNTAQGVQIDTQISYRNLLVAISGLCEAADVGIKTAFAPAGGAFQVSLYQGGEVQGVFSREYENVLAQNYTESALEYANTALVGGEGEGSDRTFVTVGSDSGEGRFELFVDAKDLRAADFPDDYPAALTFRGESKLAEQAMVQAFEAEINQYGNLRYKTDFDIGSSVRVVSPRWGISVSARITEVMESYEREGMSLDITLGKPLLTLAERQEEA